MPERPDRETLVRRLRSVALWNGGSIVAVALPAAVYCLFAELWAGVLVGLLIAAAGALELRGRMHLPAAPQRARHWLCGAQVGFFLVILVYAGWRLGMLSPAGVLEALGPELTALLKSELERRHGLAGLPDDVLGEALVRLFGIVYWALIFASLIYQGLLFLYYRRNTARLEA